MKHFFRNAETWLLIPIILVTLLAFVKYYSVAFTSTLSFDGAIIVQTAQNLARNLQYSTFYEGQLFDPIITTGITVALPAAILFRIFGESFATGLIVNANYLILALIFLVHYLKNYWKLNNWFILLAILMFTATPSLITNGFGFYGEIPMFFFMLLMLISLHKFGSTLKKVHFLWAGLFLGLAYLTKTIALICVPAIIFAVLLYFLVNKQTIQRWGIVIGYIFKSYLLLLSGFIIPVLVFELFKMISLGFATYTHMWSEQIRTIAIFAGVTQRNSNSGQLFAKLLSRLDTLSSFVGISKIIIVFLLLLVFLLFLYFLGYGIYTISKKNTQIDNKLNVFSIDTIVLVVVTLSYFGWWLLIVRDSTVWERYIFIGYVYLELSLVLVVSLLHQSQKKIVPRDGKVAIWLIRVFKALVLCLLLVLTGFNLVRTKNLAISFKDTEEKKGYLEISEFIKNLPDNSEIFGYGYWQAPVVSFVSDRVFSNILTDPAMRTPGELKEKYFVLDFYAYYLDPTGFANIIGQFDHHLVYSDEANKLYIYKLTSVPVFSYEEFSKVENDLVGYSSIDFTKNDSDVYVRNVYLEEDNQYGKWAQEVSAYLLKYSGEAKVKITLNIPGIETYVEEPTYLKIYTNRKLVYQRALVEGLQEIEIPLDAINGDTLEITIMLNTCMDAEGLNRHLSLFLQRIELIDN